MTYYNRPKRGNPVRGFFYFIGIVELIVIIGLLVWK